MHTNRGGLHGSVVVAFESRRATELANLIRRHGGLPIVAPAMRELPLEEHSAAHEFLSRLERGELDVAVMLTGVGVRTLAGTLAETCAPERLAELLGSTILVARGPKPVAELRTLGLAPQVRVPEPNTWRELLAAVDAEAPVRGRRVAVVEYGTRNVELVVVGQQLAESSRRLFSCLRALRELLLGGALGAGVRCGQDRVGVVLGEAALPVADRCGRASARVLPSARKGRTRR